MTNHTTPLSRALRGGLVGLACATGAMAEEKQPLDYLVARLPLISYAQVQNSDLPKVCGPGMMISSSLMQDVGRSDLANTSDYPMVSVLAAGIDGDACRVEINFQKYTPPGVTVVCLIKTFEFNMDMQKAVATSYDGATCSAADGAAPLAGTAPADAGQTAQPDDAAGQGGSDPAPEITGWETDTGPAAAPAEQVTATPAPPDVPQQSAQAAGPDPDSFTPGQGGYALYQNARFATFISYPETYFRPEPPPDNGDGRRFVSVDGQASFYVFAQNNVENLTPDQMMVRDATQAGLPPPTLVRSGPGWYELGGPTGDSLYFQRVIFDWDGLFRVFQIVYPASRQAEFEPVVAFMAGSFGPGTSFGDEGDAAEPMGDGPATQVILGEISTPAKGSQERAAIMNAARHGVTDLLGTSVVFIVDVLRSDGTWAYLQAVPAAEDGSPLDWDATQFAQEIRAGVMSDVYMALLQKVDGQWLLVDSILGPTDLASLGWVDSFGIPESLFLP